MMQRYTVKYRERVKKLGEPDTFREVWVLKTRSGQPNTFNDREAHWVARQLARAHGTYAIIVAGAVPVKEYHWNAKTKEVEVRDWEPPFRPEPPAERAHGAG